MSNECEKQGTSEKPGMANWENLKGGGSSRGSQRYPQEVTRLAQGVARAATPGPASVTQDRTFAQNRILVVGAQMDRQYLEVPTRVVWQWKWLAATTAELRQLDKLC